MEAELRDILERDFKAYGDPLDNVTSFRYLGQVLKAVYNDWLVVVGNLGKARKSWGRLSRILSQEGENPICCRRCYFLGQRRVCLPLA